MFTRIRSGLRSALNLRWPREGGGLVEGDATLHATLQAERQRWAAERQMLLTDCTTIRAEAQALTERLDGWSSLVRDLFFYGGLHDRVDAITQFLCARLRESVGEIDGVSEVEVSELQSSAKPSPNPNAVSELRLTLTLTLTTSLTRRASCGCHQVPYPLP